MREGPQPPRCIVESCDNRPANGMLGYCTGHEKLLGAGSTATPPITEPDDPALLERTARQAAAAEEKEYAERRRVKTWKTLENGTRVPEEYWTDDELAIIDRQMDELADAAAVRMNVRTVGAELPVTQEMLQDATDTRRAIARYDAEKADLKLLKKALRGKLGPGAEKLVRALVEHLAIGD